jgi:hypothetical protein
VRVNAGLSTTERPASSVAVQQLMSSALRSVVRANTGLNTAARAAAASSLCENALSSGFRLKLRILLHEIFATVFRPIVVCGPVVYTDGTG